MFYEIAIIVSYFIAGVGCFTYVWTRRQRKWRALFGWLAVPCFFFAGMELYFVVNDIPLPDRVLPARIFFITFAWIIAFITLITSYFNKQ